ncbi:hypothetical protein APHAL10511_002402 [Amanita phalloides]|nr:hypothetical protein APHAL10511_002402 [Amanita phalloides]
MSKIGRTSYDFVPHILDALCDNYNALYKCSLVSKDFNVIASRLLYHRVVFSPPFRPVLNLRDRGTLTEPSQFTSACLPQYAPLVKELRISGFLSTRPPPLHTFSVTLLNAVRVFDHLRAVCFTPTTYHEELFTQTLQALIDIGSLEDLAVNSSCTDAPRAPLITQIRGLSKLELHNPTRAILELLPDWLDQLSETLRELHLKGNCGSITPGVLNAFVLPPLQSHLRALSLGLSYSLTHDITSKFLNNFSQLEELELRYYWQLKEPTIHLTLGRLRKFTVLYAKTAAKREASSLCKWMRTVISRSPIEVLHVACDQADDNTNSGANISFDSIIDHLSKKHAATVHFLDLRSSYVGVAGLRALFSSCLQLEQFHVAAGKGALTIFEQHYGELKHLRVAGFELHNVNRRKRQLNRESVRGLMQNGPSTFRTLIMNGITWMGFWTAEPGGNIVFAVDVCAPVKFPWERE